jgi:hypothetical protein
LTVRALFLLVALSACNDEERDARVCMTTSGQSSFTPSDGCNEVQQGSNVTVSGAPSGFEDCGDGILDRKEARACAMCHDIELCSGCSTCESGDCIACDGTCVIDGWGDCTCAHLCSDDDDCGPGRACLCPLDDRDHAWPRCIDASACRTNDDCGPGGRCGLSSVPCDGADALACRTAFDDCERSCPTCRFDEELGHFTCISGVDCN